MIFSCYCWRDIHQMLIKMVVEQKRKWWVLLAEGLIFFFCLLNTVTFIIFLHPCYNPIFSSSDVFEGGHLASSFCLQCSWNKITILQESTNAYNYFFPCLFLLLLFSTHNNFKQLHSVNNAPTEFKAFILTFMILSWIEQEK